jgi:hypothetical protein
MDTLAACLDQWHENCATLSASSGIKDQLVIVESQINGLPSSFKLAESAHSDLAKHRKDEESKTAVYLSLLSVRDAIARLDDELHKLLFIMLEEVP